MTCASVAPRGLAAASLGLAVLLLAPSGNGVAAAATQARQGVLAGVYKTQFDNGLVTGERYRSENILEIVDVSAATAYVRLELDFFNGHVCSLWGIADRVGPTLVYTGKSIFEGGPCVLTVKTAGGKVVLSDRDGICRRNSCGARGGFEGISFPVSARRPIRYMARLKASTEYKEAVAAYGKR